MSTETVSYDELEWEFGDRIRKVRRKIARMDQVEMAVVLGVSQKVYATWESGRSKPSDIVKISKRIEELWPGRVTAAWMLGIDEAPGPRGGEAQHFSDRDLLDETGDQDSQPSGELFKAA